MIHCDKGHENPDGALFCKACGAKLDGNVNFETINYHTYYGKLTPYTKFILYIFLLSILLSLIGFLLFSENYFENGNSWGMIGFLLFFPSFSEIITFLIQGDLNRKCFAIPLSLTESKEAILRTVFNGNKTLQNKESFRIKTQKDNTVIFYNSIKKEDFYLLANANGQTVLIGRRHATIELIRTVFGSQLNFIETKNL